MKVILFVIIEVLEFVLHALWQIRNDKFDKIDFTEIEEAQERLRIAKESL